MANAHGWNLGRLAIIVGLVFLVLSAPLACSAKNDDQDSKRSASSKKSLADGTSSLAGKPGQKIKSAQWDGDKTIVMDVNISIQDEDRIVPVVCWRGHANVNATFPETITKGKIPSIGEVVFGSIAMANLETQVIGNRDPEILINNPTFLVPFQSVDDISLVGVLEIVPLHLRQDRQKYRLSLEALQVMKDPGMLPQVQNADLKPRFVYLAPSPYKRPWIKNVFSSLSKPLSKPQKITLVSQE